MTFTAESGLCAAVRCRIGVPFFALMSAMAALTTIGCGSSHAEDAIDSGTASDSGIADSRDQEGGDTNPPTDATPVVWAKCMATGGCAKFELPLNYASAAGETVTVKVDRYKASGTSKGQVFLVQGGPAVSGRATLDWWAIELSRDAGFEVFVVDQRGIEGTNAFPDCADLRGVAFPDDAVIAKAGAACVAKFDAAKAKHFSAANQGRDLGEIIGRVRDATVPAYVYAASYGTRVALRYLQQFPTQVDGVVLDSSLSESTDYTVAAEANADDQHRWLLGRCGADPFCSSKLGSDPVKKLADVLAKTDGGWCPTSASIRPIEYRNMIAGTYTLGVEYRELVAALLYRVDRCNAEDQKAIAKLYGQFGSPPPPTFNVALHLQIVTSEAIPNPPPSVAVVTAATRASLLGTDNSLGYRRLWDVWPRYPADAYMGKYPSTSIPILMMHGTHDAQASYSDALKVAAAIAAPNHRLITARDGTHGLIGTWCGRSIIRVFLADPKATIDTACADMPAVLDFEKVSGDIFGTPDAWGG